jgi:aldoxime dehydratase
MESAIPAHLSVERVHPPRHSRSFHPPYPSFSARFDPAVEQVVMAYLGVQYATPKPPTLVSIALADLLASAHSVDGPDHRDQSHHRGSSARRVKDGLSEARNGKSAGLCARKIL